MRQWEIGNAGANTVMSIPIDRTGDLRDGVMVTLTTQDGTAVAGHDYRKVAGRFAIPPGKSSASANVTILGEPGPQSDKRFYLQLQRAVSTGGPASFTAPRFVDNVNPHAMQVADLNHDGFPDVLAINTTEGPGHAPSAMLKVLLNASAANAAAASFRPIQSINLGSHWLYTLAVADVNHDGKPDIIAVDDHYARGLVWLNLTPVGATTVTLASPQSFELPSPLINVATADLDGDGRPDLIVLATNNEIATVLNRTEAGATTASFLPYAVVPIGGHGWNTASADVDGDGKVDVLVNNPGNNAIEILRNTTAPGDDHVTLSAPQEIPAGGPTYHIVVDDFDRDGRPDIIASPMGKGMSVIHNQTLPGAESFSFADPQHIPMPDMPGDLARADFNRDGVMDLVTNMQALGNVTILFNVTGRGESAAQYVQRSFRIAGDTTEPVLRVGKGDFNQDGRPDIVTQAGGRIATLMSTLVPPTYSTVRVPQIIHYPAPH